MTILTWAIRLVIFGFLLVFALQNTDTVSLRFLPEHVWQAPLVIVLLLFFIGGVFVGALSLLPTLYRQRHETSRLKRATREQAPVVPQPPQTV